MERRSFLSGAGLIGLGNLIEIMRGAFPRHHVEMMPSTAEMLIALRKGEANWRLWIHSSGFRLVVESFGTDADKLRLSRLEEEYRARFRRRQTALRSNT